MKQQHASHPGRAIAYLLVGLLGGVLGGLVVTWMGGASNGTGVRAARPYREQPSPAVPVSVAGGANVVDAVQKVGPAVVNINTVGAASRREGGLPDALRRLFPYPEQQEPMPSEGRGSGVIINGEKGYVLTNNHVVANAGQITVLLPDKRSFEATVIGTDPYGDIALLKMNGSDLPEATLGDSDNLPIGSTAIAIGNPFGFENTVTVGVVSAVNRELPAPGNIPLEHLIQTDAAINPGNSGGPLCDINGNIIGMNTAIIPYGQGIGFAVAVNAIKRSIDEIVQHGRARRPWLGITFQEISQDVARELGVPEANGLLVRAVVPRSPADRAGLREGDVLTSINGKKLLNDDDLRGTIRRAGVGETIKLTGYRGNRPLEFQVKLGEMPPPDQLRQQ
jgi:serine protease Do